MIKDRKEEESMPNFQYRDLAAAIDRIEACQPGATPAEKVLAIEGLQFIIDHGIAWSMNDNIAHLAERAIEEGWCHITHH